MIFSTEALANTPKNTRVLQALRLRVKIEQAPSRGSVECSNANVPMLQMMIYGVGKLRAERRQSRCLAMKRLH